MKINYSDVPHKKLAQIVPRIFPATDGVGDYALNLARQLRQDYNIQTHFVVCDRHWSGDNIIDGFPVSQLSSPTAKELSSWLLKNKVNTVLLQYVGYGYAQRGCPTWLVEGLKTWRTKSDRHILVTMFHEIYASGAIWQSAFWLSGIQKRIAGCLIQSSDRIITNRQASAEILSTIGKVNINCIEVIPVFSNIGEPQKLVPFAQRKKRLVIFGHANSKLRVYQNYIQHLENIYRAFAIEEIYDIGNYPKFDFNSISQFKVKTMGILPAEQISEILANSSVGFMAFPQIDYLGKSGVFASYCAYGLVPVLPFTNSKNVDGLEANQNYLSVQKPTDNISISRAESIARNAYQWYQNHNLFQQAKIVASLFD